MNNLTINLKVNENSDVMSVRLGNGFSIIAHQPITLEAGINWLNSVPVRLSPISYKVLVGRLDKEIGAFWIGQAVDKRLRYLFRYRRRGERMKSRN